MSRPSPSSDALRAAFTTEETRTQRRSDGTVSVASIRFEVPARFRHVERLTVRYARWDLSYVLLVDGKRGTVLDRLYPLDKTKNADGIRRPLAPITTDPPAAAAEPGVAPLLEKLMHQYRATGLPPAYLPKDDLPPTEEEPR